jgi:hypothetical protein
VAVGVVVVAVAAGVDGWGWVAVAGWQTPHYLVGFGSELAVSRVALRVGWVWIGVKYVLRVGLCAVGKGCVVDGRHLDRRGSRSRFANTSAQH